MCTTSNETEDFMVQFLFTLVAHRRRHTEARGLLPLLVSVTLAIATLIIMIKRPIDCLPINCPPFNCSRSTAPSMGELLTGVRAADSPHTPPRHSKRAQVKSVAHVHAHVR